jgi:hypothetical protein
MFEFSHRVEVNPAGAEPPLTREQLWRGLEMKAENAVPFVPGMESCVVLERTENGLVREAVYRGTTIREQITFDSPNEVVFQRVGDPSWVKNTIHEIGGKLWLEFTFALVFDGIPQDSEEERQHGEQVKSDYFAAVNATLRTVRRMVSDGAL